MRGFLFIGLFVVMGCAKKVSEKDLNYLNGYWEIEKVTFSDGSHKEYKVNANVDYIAIDDFKGFRKKVQPKFDGTYTASDDATLFIIRESGGEFNIYYKNDRNDWKERIASISQNNFSVINEENIRYSYKRYQPINAKD
ncbi:MAG: hypothetical protein WBG90_07680 [Saonia sp.]